MEQIIIFKFCVIALVSSSNVLLFQYQQTTHMIYNENRKWQTIYILILLIKF